jgi:hypothetical protein
MRYDQLEHAIRAVCDVSFVPTRNPVFYLARIDLLFQELCNGLSICECGEIGIRARLGK